MTDGGAWESDFEGDTYSVQSTSPNNKLFPLRVRLQEDRIITIQKKFFCDRTTEKTLTLILKDPLQNTRRVSTRKVSCQYDLVEITDLSFDHPENTKNNSWHLLQPFPTKEDLELDPYFPKIYRASAWVTESETLKFKVKFAEGSHVKVTWKISVPNDENDDCKTEDEKICVFPFRYNSILYYGCTMLEDEGNQKK